MDRTRERGPSSTGRAAKDFSNIATGRADAVDAAGERCTSSASFAALPGMSKTFSFGGAAERPVLVLFTGVFDTSPQAQAELRLVIDGVVQSGAGELIVRKESTESHLATEGFNFVSDAVAPGTHTAELQWRVFVSSVCIRARSLIVLHR